VAAVVDVQTAAGLADASPVAVEFLPNGFIPPRQTPLPE